MEQDIKNKILTTLDRLRYDKHFTGFRDTKLLELIGNTFGIERLELILQDKELVSSIVNSYSLVLPLFIFDFLKELIKTEIKNSIIDPWLTLASPILYINENNIYGTCINKSEFKTIVEIFKNISQNFKIGDTLEELSKTNDVYDLVLSFPPMGMRTQYINGIQTTFDFSTTLLLKCANLLSQNGKIVFIVSNSFLLNDKAKEEIKKAGLFVDGIFALPTGALEPNVGVSTSLIFVSKQKKEKTFVAEISQDGTTNKPRFRIRKKGLSLEFKS